jgi:hypothetical protein
VVADIVDDNEWNKVLKGVYTGFSIGGSYAKKWTDPVEKSAKRYTAKPSEVSIVDVGCNPDATFCMVKADGVETEVKFEDTEQGILNKMQDDATTAEEKLELVRKLATLNGVELAKVEEAAPVVVEEDLTKSGYTIGQLARLADDVRCFCGYDAIMYNPDGSTTPRSFTPELKAAATALYDALLKLVAEDVAEAKEKLKAMKKQLDDEEGEPLRKAADIATAEHDTLGQVCKVLGVEEGATLESVVDTLSKSVSEHGELQKKYEEQGEELAKLKEQPVPPKGVQKIVPISKTDDGTAIQKMEQAAEPDEKDPLKLMKRVHSAGGRHIAPGAVLAKKDQ